MAFRLIDRHFLTGVAVSGFMIALAGCQSGKNTSDTLAADGNQDQAKVSESDLRAFCPPITLHEDTGYFNSYAKGGQDDPAKIAYQASITDVTRNCTRADGMMTITVAVAGRVVPGPAGAAGTVNLPIRVVATRGSEILYAKTHSYQVALSGGTAASQFVFSDPNVIIPIPAEKDVQVLAGYDEGPPKKQ